MTNKLDVIINSLKVPKIKKNLLYEMKFLVPNYSCLQSPWLGGTVPRSPFSLSSVLNWICWTPPPKKKSWVRHWYDVHKNRYPCSKTVTVWKLLFQQLETAQDDSGSSNSRKTPFSLTWYKGHKIQLRSHCCRSLDAFAKSWKATC